MAARCGGRIFFVVLLFFIFIVKSASSSLSYTSDQLWDISSSIPRGFSNVHVLPDEVLRPIGEVQHPRHRRRQRGKRGGRLRCKFVFHNVHGKRSFLNDPSSLPELKKNTCIFLSETWSLNPSSSCPGKTFYSSPAVKAASRGRPSGGLELYVSPSFPSRLLSSSNHHIAVFLASINVSVVGVYYKPGLDFDEVVEDITKAVDASPSGSEVIVDGDLNLKSSDDGFNVLSDLQTERHFSALRTGHHHLHLCERRIRHRPYLRLPLPGPGDHQDLRGLRVLLRPRLGVLVLPLLP